MPFIVWSFLWSEVLSCRCDLAARGCGESMTSQVIPLWKRRDWAAGNRCPTAKIGANTQRHTT